MRITLAQIEAFHSVVRLGTVREAAQHLNLAQPTVSLRIKNLEQALGMQIFERSGRGLRLSHQGLGLVDHAKAVLREVGKLKGRADRQEVGGVVRLGVSETFAVGGLPALLKVALKDFPGLRVELVIGASPDLVTDLLEHRIDMAIAVNPADEPRLTIIPLGVQPATWASAPELNLPAVIRPADVLHYTVLVNPSPYPDWVQTISWFRTAGIEPPHLSMCRTVPSMIAHLIEAGLGIAILPTRLIEPQIRAGTLVAHDSIPNLGKSFLCAVHRSEDTEPALEALVSRTRQILSDLDMLENE